jgi:hypothetical protein
VKALNSFQDDDNIFTCPLNGKDISHLYQFLKKLLETTCTYCKKSGLEYHDDKECPNNCKVCLKCQNSLIKKQSVKPHCPHCKQQLKSLVVSSDYSTLN